MNLFTGDDAFMTVINLYLSVAFTVFYFQGVGGWGYGCEEVIAAVMLGHTPLAWAQHCSYPAPSVLHHFIHDLHVRMQFFRVSLDNNVDIFMYI